MSCGSSDLTIYLGDTKTITSTFTNADGTPIDLTGKTVIFAVAQAPVDLDVAPIIEITNTVHSDPTAGITVFNITTAMSELLAAEYNYQYSITYVDGVTVRNTVLIARFIALEPNIAP